MHLRMFEHNLVHCYLTERPSDMKRLQGFCQWIGPLATFQVPGCTLNWAAKSADFSGWLLAFTGLLLFSCSLLAQTTVG